MKIDDRIKDYQVAYAMFGRNTAKECRIVKQLRKGCEVEPLDEYFFIIRKIGVDDCGYVIPSEFIIE